MSARAITSGVGAAAALAALAIVLFAGQVSYSVAAISVVTVLFYAMRVVPEVLTSIWVCLAFLAIGAAPAGVVFSGFATGGMWLLISGLIIGTAISQTGLGKTLAARLFTRIGGSYARAVLLLAVAGVALGVLIPSTIPRVIVLVPIAMALAETMGHAPGSRAQVGLTVTAASATLLPTYAILTANLPTIVHVGALETLYGLHPSYGAYFLYQMPVNVVRFVLIVLVLIPLAKGAPGAAAAEGAAPMTPVQKRLLAVLIVAIGFWATDTWHGISPAWIALTAASVALLPASGFLKADAMKTAIDFSPVLFLAGVFAISAVVTHIGLDATLAEAVLPRLGLAAGADLWNLYSIVASSSLLSHFTTAPAAPVVLAPLAAPMAEASGWPLETVAMAQIIGIATPLLAYQAPPLIIAMSLAQIPMAALARLCLALVAGVLVIGLPLTYGWWWVIGAF